MKKMICKLALLAFAAVAGSAQALPVAGQGTWETTLLGRDINGNAVAGSDVNSIFLYDTVLNITWLRDGNVTGPTSWDDANTWAANLAVGDFHGWRLPTMIANPNSNYGYSGTDYGYNVRTTSGGIVYSEMASLWYDALGNTAYYDTTVTAEPLGWGLTNTGDFQKLNPFYYWSGLEFSPSPSSVWVLNAGDGFQGSFGKNNTLPAMAVRDGDVLVSAVPEPETYALILVGLAAIGAAARRRQLVTGGSKRAAP